MARSQLLAKAEALAIDYLLAPETTESPLANLGDVGAPNATLVGNAVLVSPGLYDGGVAVALDGAGDYVQTGFAWTSGTTHNGTSYFGLAERDESGGEEALWGSNAAGGNFDTLRVKEATNKVELALNSVFVANWPEGFTGASALTFWGLTVDLSAKTAFLYVNGTYTEKALSGTPTYTTGNALNIGARREGADPLKGKLLPFGFTRSVLTKAQFEELEEAALAPTPYVPTKRKRKPPLELDAEVETAEGTVIRLPADARKAGDRPVGLSFETQRGDGFGTGGLVLNRQIFRDYPDVGLLDTWRMVGRQGDIAYEGRLHSNPRTNDPSQQIQIALVGWSSYLKGRPIAPLIIDRRLAGWGEPSTQRRANRLGGGARYEGQVVSGFQEEGAAGPAVVISISRFDGTLTELGEAWMYAGGEDIGELRAHVSRLTGGANADFQTFLRLSNNDTLESFDSSADYNYGNTENGSVEASTAGRKYALLQTEYAGTFAGDGNNTLAFEYPRILGTHGLTERGTKPEEGFWISDIIRYVIQTYRPKLSTAGIQDNTFPLTQATWHDSPADPFTVLTQLNDLTLWNMGVEEGPTFYYRPADLTKYDWQIRTDDPGVSVNFQGDSIENFANGIVVTYSDFYGHTFTLYPPDHEELRDVSEDNPATRHGEDLWGAVTVPFKCLEAEALQFGRAYLAEYNRPKRPGSFTTRGGYIRDAAGHWQQGWKVREGQTLIVADHPAEHQPRLITSTSWDQESLSLTIQVDAPSNLMDAVQARHERALEAKSIS